MKKLKINWTLVPGQNIHELLEAQRQDGSVSRWLNNLKEQDLQDLIDEVQMLERITRTA